MIKPIVFDIDNTLIVGHTNGNYLPHMNYLFGDEARRIQIIKHIHLLHQNDFKIIFLTRGNYINSINLLQDFFQDMDTIVNIDFDSLKAPLFSSSMTPDNLRHNISLLINQNYTEQFDNQLLSLTYLNIRQHNWHIIKSQFLTLIFNLGQPNIIYFFDDTPNNIIQAQQTLQNNIQTFLVSNYNHLYELSYLLKELILSLNL